MSLFHASIITLFPEMFPAILNHSISGAALLKNIWSFDTINIRDFGITKHRNVDDKAYGGGKGMVLKPDVAAAAIDCAISKYPESKIYYPSPRGALLKQKKIKEISTQKNIVILCVRFEGIDERVIEEYNIEEFSIGDYILSGGELAALVMLDSIIRLLPNVLDVEATSEESFEETSKFCGLLEPNLYTRPALWRNKKVPEVLLSGNHQDIEDWKIEQSLSITKNRRPDLLK